MKLYIIVWGIDSASTFEILISAVISMIHTYSTNTTAYYTLIFTYTFVKKKKHHFVLLSPSHSQKMYYHRVN